MSRNPCRQTYCLCECDAFFFTDQCEDMYLMLFINMNNHTVLLFLLWRLRRSCLFSINAKLFRFIVRVIFHRVESTCCGFGTFVSARHCLRDPSVCIQRPAAWRSGGFHCKFCGLLSFVFARHFQRSYCRRCAKPLVICRPSFFLFNSIKPFQFCYFFVFFR